MPVRAAVLTGKHTIELQELPGVAALAPGEALLRVEGCGICGSDVELFELAGPPQYMRVPLIPGHEIVGRIAAITPEARDAWGVGEGARVAVIGGPRCGQCRNCATGIRCPQTVSYGFRSAAIGSGLWGGFAEQLHLLAGSRVRPVPEHLSVADAVLFNPLAAGLDWVVRVAGAQVGDAVAILGPGQRGLACVVAAREAGAAQIIVTGLPRDAAKLALARELGATATFLADDPDLVPAVRDLTGGGADRVIETTPVAAKPVVDALDMARVAGTVVLAGLKGGNLVPNFSPDRVVHGMLTVIGVTGTSDWASEQAIRVVASGRYPLERMHTHTVGLDSAARAIQLLAGEVPGEDPIHITVTP